MDGQEKTQYTDIHDKDRGTHKKRDEERNQTTLAKVGRLEALVYISFKDSIILSQVSTVFSSC